MLCFDVSVAQITLRGEWAVRILLEAGAAILCSTGGGGRAAQGVRLDGKQREKGMRLCEAVGDAEQPWLCWPRSTNQFTATQHLACEARVLSN